jgi:hypothetical protein
MVLSWTEDTFINGIVDIKLRIREESHANNDFHEKRPNGWSRSFVPLDLCYSDKSTKCGEISFTHIEY